MKKKKVRHNSKNPKIGKQFQKAMLKLLENEFGIEFNIELPLKIGNPAKDHKFDFVSKDELVVGESKFYSWTVTNNVPSAKLGFLNEAAFYLSFLSKTKTKFILIRKHYNSKRKKTLAQHYVDTYRHLLGDIRVFEANFNSKEIEIIYPQNHD